MAIKEQRDVTKPVANNSYSMKHKKKKNKKKGKKKKNKTPQHYLGKYLFYIAIFFARSYTFSLCRFFFLRFGNVDLFWRFKADNFQICSNCTYTSKPTEAYVMQSFLASSVS